MQKLELTKCKICNRELTVRGFSQHVVKSHEIPFIDYLISYEFNNNPPKCKCGCGKNVTIRGLNVMDYVKGHCTLTQFKQGQTPERSDNWKRNLRAGIIKWNQDAKMKNPDYRKGQNNNFYGKTHTEETKDILRQKTIEQIISGTHPFIGNNNGRIGTSSLETKFSNYLKSKNVNFFHSFKVPYLSEKNYIKYKYYDFYIPIINTLIEIHGSYWHPQHCDNISLMQQNNLENDKFKKRLAKSNYFNILTIYDYELDDFIKNNSITEIWKILGNKIDLSYYGLIKNSTKEHIIELPDYWVKLVDPESITVNLTPIGTAKSIAVKKIEGNKIYLNSGRSKTVDCYYMVLAERKDVDKLQVEI